MRRHLGFVCSAVAFVALVARGTGCTSSSSDTGPADCVAAGGECQIPNSQCEKVGPQDCNPPPRSLGGQYCCLAESPTPAAPTCALGAACSNVDICLGGIAGCVSNCQCLNGTWQAPCPAAVPSGGAACSVEGATCGYVTQATACGGSVDCDCQGGAWGCGPTCVEAPTGADAGPDADGCPQSACDTSCPAGTHDVSAVVDGCLVWQCCVPEDDAGPDATTDAAADASARDAADAAGE